MSTPVTNRLDKRIITLWSHISDPDSWEPALKEWEELLTSFGPRYPQPGFIGSNYFGSKPRLVVLGINPGPGTGFETRDKRIFAKILRLASSPTEKNFLSLMEIYERNMAEWDIFSRCRFPESFGLTFNDIAFFNVLQVNTDISCTSEELDLVYEFAIVNFTSKQLSLLRPDAILIMGSHAQKMLEKYWSNRPGNLDILSIWHPTSKYVRNRLEKFERKLDEARDFVARIRDG